MKIDDKNFINKIKELANAILETVNEKNTDKGLIKTNVVSILTLCDVVQPCDIEQEVPPIISTPLFAPHDVTRKQLPLDFTCATKEQYD